MFIEVRLLLDLDSISEILREKLDTKRYLHSLGVQKVAVDLAVRYNVSIKKAAMAGLVHDCAKNLNNNELLQLSSKFDILLDNVLRNNIKLLHGPVGAELAKYKFCIQDIDVLNAIRFHSTGRENMSPLEKIIFLADYIEPNRDFAGVDQLRSIALSNLDKATLMAFEHTIEYVLKKGDLLHVSTIHARNYLLLDINHKRS